MPIKVIYINPQNIKTEASVYTASEFVSTGPVANSPVITGAGGIIDSSLLPDAGTVESATKLKITRIAQEAIFTSDVVRASSATQVVTATADTTKDQAQVLGIAANDAAIGEIVDIVLLGVVTDAIFSVFNLNDPLFLDVDGSITNIKRTTGYHVTIGKALGGNDILFEPSTPLVIA